MNWKNIKEETPKDGQRVLVWNTKYNEVTIQVWNKLLKCWDTEDGDDYDWDMEICPYWMELPEEPTQISK